MSFPTCRNNFWATPVHYAGMVLLFRDLMFSGFNTLKKRIVGSGVGNGCGKTNYPEWHVEDQMLSILPVPTWQRPFPNAWMIILLTFYGIGFCQDNQDHDTYLQIDVYELQQKGDTDGRLVGQAKLAIYPRGGEYSPRKEHRLA